MSVHPFTFWTRLAACVAWLFAACCAGAAAVDPMLAVAVAPGVFVFPGVPAAPTVDNGGKVTNVGVIIGSSGVVLVGSGTSDAHGEALLRAVKALSDLPVVLVINTYAGPEHVLGNSAFARHGIPILAHRETDIYMARNCINCIRNLKTAIGEAPLQDSKLERASQLIEASTSLLVGGRRLEMLYYGATQQPGSIAVFDQESGVLFTGALATFDVIPDAHDGELAAWQNALQEMARLPVRQVVPARGPVSAPARLAEMGDYLKGLAEVTARAYQRGVDLADAPHGAALPRFSRWALYETQHPRNVHFQYLKLEAQELAR